MAGRAARLVLYLGWPGVLALGVFLAGLRLGDDALPPERRMSTAAYGKFDALSACVEVVTGERQASERVRDSVLAAVAGLEPSGRRLFLLAPPFTLPAYVDAECPREPAHVGIGARPRRVAERGGENRPQPSPYHLHVFVLPPPTLAALQLDRDLGSRRLVVEEYVIGGPEPNQVLLGVTLGLYASADELADRASLRRLLVQQLQLREPGAQAP